MKEITQHPPGTFSWVDLATTKPEAAKRFYTELFGWTAVDTPAGEDSVYTMLNLDEKPVAALFAITRDQREDGMRPHWDSYVTVADEGRFSLEPYPAVRAWLGRAEALPGWVTMPRQRPVVT